jgi:hypothetical protein
MSAIVQFPEGGAYPSAPLTDQDERVIALIGRCLAAHRACQCFLEENPYAPQTHPEQLGHHHDAMGKPEDELAEIANRDGVICGLLEALGNIVIDSARPAVDDAGSPR